ncbi:hypothetical protein ACFW81_24015 [Streptomyces angustmyceticus]|uniref:hypothetical protein n=1 Tax=Streptomyces angustmyceticus TaxID=285578 RepID=UPI0036B591F9
MTTAELPATPPTSSLADRYAIGRNGVFATLYDRQERRLLVENATEEHCLKVRDQLIDGQRAEQRHQLFDLDTDSTHTVPGCICACPPKAA